MKAFSKFPCVNAAIARSEPHPGQYPPVNACIGHVGYWPGVAGFLMVTANAVVVKMPTMANRWVPTVFIFVFRNPTVNCVVIGWRNGTPEFICG